VAHPASATSPPPVCRVPERGRCGPQRPRPKPDDRPGRKAPSPPAGSARAVGRVIARTPAVAPRTTMRQFAGGRDHSRLSRGCSTAKVIRFLGLGGRTPPSWAAPGRRSRVEFPDGPGFQKRITTGRPPTEANRPPSVPEGNRQGRPAWGAKEKNRFSGILVAAVPGPPSPRLGNHPVRKPATTPSPAAVSGLGGRPRTQLSVWACSSVMGLLAATCPRA